MRVQKDGRVLTCEHVPLPHGTDVRLIEDSEFRRMQFVWDDNGQRRALATEWLTKLQAAVTEGESSVNRNVKVG